LPREERKGYLLQPQVFLDLERMADEILQADGITREALDDWRAKMKLIHRFLDAPNDNVLRIMARENDAQLDEGFFRALRLYTGSMKADGEEELARRLLSLNEKLIELSSLGKRRGGRREVIEALGKGMTKEDFLQRLMSCDDQARLEGMVDAGFSLLDYWFFKALTDKIESAQAEGRSQEAQRLTELRSKILDIRSEIEKEERAGFQRATELLRDIMRSEDIEQAVQDRLGEIDDFFFAVLSANIDGAESAGLKEEAEKMKHVRDIALGLLKETMPPQVRLINRLLKAAYPEETKRLLEENADQVDQSLVELMDLMTMNLRQEGEIEAARRLSKIREQVVKMT
ncbi:MAG: hypothetical protein U9R11_03925, partial [Chloroflexota bacterium]|nr:hypothetical protein [Chloroflexota bacterium]